MIPSNEYFIDAGMDPQETERLIKVAEIKAAERMAEFFESTGRTPYLSDDDTIFGKAYYHIIGVYSLLENFEIKKSAKALFTSIHYRCATEEGFLEVKALLEQFLSAHKEARIAIVKDEYKHRWEELCVSNSFTPEMMIEDEIQQKFLTTVMFANLGKLIRGINRHRFITKDQPDVANQDSIQADEVIDSLTDEVADCLREFNADSNFPSCSFLIDFAVFTSTHQLAIAHTRKFIADHRLSETIHKRLENLQQFFSNLKGLVVLEEQLDSRDYENAVKKANKCMDEIRRAGIIPKLDTQLAIDAGDRHPDDPVLKVIKNFTTSYQKSLTAQEKKFNFFCFIGNYMEAMMSNESTEVKTKEPDNNHVEKSEKRNHGKNELPFSVRSNKKPRAISTPMVTEIPPILIRMVPYVQSPPKGMEQNEEKEEHSPIECDVCQERFTNKEANYYKLDCNLHPAYCVHETCFKKILLNRGVDATKRKERKGAGCVRENCEGHLIFMLLIKKGGIEDKPLYCD